MHYDTVYTVELGVTVPIPEWDGQELTFSLEQDAAFLETGAVYLDGRQTRLRMIETVEAQWIPGLPRDGADPASGRKSDLVRAQASQERWSELRLVQPCTAGVVTGCDAVGEKEQERLWREIA